MPQINITVTRPEVAVSTTQTGPTVTISETPVEITQNTSTIAVTSSPQTVTVNTAATTIQTTTLDEAFKGEWSNEETYHRGDLVRHEQGVYVFINTTPQTTDAPDVDTDLWVLLFSESGLTGEQVVGINRAINFTTWSPTTAYSIGDIVVLRGDYEDSMDPVSNTTYPKFTLYRLCHISGSINKNPANYCSPPDLDESNNVVFGPNSAWQNLSGVRSIDGFSGDISLQALLDHGSVSLNALDFEQGSNENHGSFVSHADSAYFYGDALYIGGSTSTAIVGFLLTNEGGSGYVVMDPATGKLVFSNDLTNQYPLPESTDDLAEGSTNKYYSDTLVDSHLSGGTGVTYTDGVIAIGQPVATTDSPTFDTVYAGMIRSPLNESVTLRAYNDTGAGTNYDLSVATTGQVNLPTGTTGQARVQSTDDISVLADTKEWVFGTDGSLAMPEYTLPATDGTANQVMTTNGSGTVSFATPSTSNVTEGTNLYYTDGRFDSRLATKDTDDLAEGSNLYYTTARQNTDFDARLATKSTTNLTEGTNLYYTTTRANSDFDTRLATKSTTNLAEGTNLYHTAARARGAISGSTGISYNNTTGAISIDDTVVATHSYVGTAIANLVDSSPSTLDTLNELAAALGDDPNFATTVSTALGNKLNTADFTSTANTWYATSNPIQNNDTDDLAEGATNKYYTETRATNNFENNLSLADTNDLAEGSTNKYYTDGRARLAISASGSLSYDSNTGVVSYTTPSTSGITEGTNLYYTDARARDAISVTTTAQTSPIPSATLSYNSSTGVLTSRNPDASQVDGLINDVDLDQDGDGAVYVKSIRDTTRVKGAFEASRNDSYTFPAAASQLVSGNNGFDASSSGPDAAGPKGYGASNSVTQYFGDTAAGVNSSASMTFRGAQGTNSAPSAILSANVMGTFNWTGYSGTDFATNVATASGGGGRQALHPLQMQGYTTQTFAESTITLATTAAIQQSLTIGSVSSSGSGVFTNTSGDIRAYDVVRVTGTLSGTMTFPGYASGNLYYVLAGGNPTTTFTLSSVHDGDPIATTAGTTTGLTFTRHRSLITFAAQTYAPFGNGSLITVAGITPAGYNGSHRTIFGTTTQVAYGNYQTGGIQTVAGTVSTGNNVTSGGSGFRIRGFANGAIYNTANRINFLDLNGATGSLRTDAVSFTPVTTTTNYASFNSANTFLRDITSNTVYASLGYAGNTFTVSGANNFIKQGTTNSTLPALFVRYQRTDTTGSNDGDGVDFRLGTGGTTTTNNIARIDAQYRTTGLHDVGISVSNDNFAADADTVYRANAESTKIRAVPAGGGTASDIMVISDVKILNNRPHRGAVTTASMARGGTYTPAVGANNFIELTLTAGTDPTYIDVDNLTVAGEGGHQAILVYNNSGSTVGVGDLVIRNNGTQINDTQSTVTNGSRVIFTVYCVGNYASCEYMHAA
jgi:hypothetical protein